MDLSDLLPLSTWQGTVQEAGRSRFELIQEESRGHAKTGGPDTSAGQRHPKNQPRIHHPMWVINGVYHLSQCMCCLFMSFLYIISYIWMMIFITYQNVPPIGVSVMPMC